MGHVWRGLTKSRKTSARKTLAFFFLKTAYTLCSTLLKAMPTATVLPLRHTPVSVPASRLCVGVGWAFMNEDGLPNSLPPPAPWMMYLHHG